MKNLAEATGYFVDAQAKEEDSYEVERLIKPVKIEVAESRIVSIEDDDAVYQEQMKTRKRQQDLYQQQQKKDFVQLNKTPTRDVKV